MTKILYEHPLNERIRNYLKLEQLFRQAQDCLSLDISVAYHAYFDAIFSIIDTLERNDIRGDLIKELDKLVHNMVYWSTMPDVDENALQTELKQIVTLVSQLKKTNQLWYQLKEDKLLASLKQRCAIQGASSTFDLPQLQFWLNLPAEKTSIDTSHWLSCFDHVKQALDSILKYIRLRGEFQRIDTDSGFFQDNGEGVLLLRIKIEKSAKHYPTISGNRFRYSIRFMLPCPEKGHRYSKQATTFELARC